MSIIHYETEEYSLPPVPRTVIYAALGTLSIEGDRPAIASGSMIISGDAKGVAAGSLGVGDVNTFIYDESNASVAVGLSADPGDALSSLEPEGGTLKQAGISLDIRRIQSPPAPALASFETVKGSTYAALESAVIKAKTIRGAGASLSVFRNSTDIALAVLLVNKPPVLLGVLASLIVGGKVTGQARGSLEAQTGDGIEVMIDIIDDILYSGHGDDC